TPMISYINVHAVLDGRRNRAKASPSDSDTSQSSVYGVLRNQLLSYKITDKLCIMEAVYNYGIIKLMNEEAIPIASQAGFALPFSRRQKALESIGALSANR
ncbi:hypothetical protein HAX54_044472, partial [Datura stramonium]|nr:hypothetical protein [Datura stramonium]